MNNYKVYSVDLRKYITGKVPYLLIAGRVHETKGSRITIENLYQLEIADVVHFNLKSDNDLSIVIPVEGSMIKL